MQQRTGLLAMLPTSTKSCTIERLRLLDGKTNDFHKNCLGIGGNPARNADLRPDARASHNQTCALLLRVPKMFTIHDSCSQLRGAHHSPKTTFPEK